MKDRPGMLAWLAGQDVGVMLRDRAGNTAIHEAGMRGRFRLMETLLKCGAPYKMRNAAGHLPEELIEGEGTRARFETLCEKHQHRIRSWPPEVQRAARLAADGSDPQAARVVRMQYEREDTTSLRIRPSQGPTMPAARGAAPSTPVLSEVEQLRRDLANARREQARLQERVEHLERTLHQHNIPFG